MLEVSKAVWQPRNRIISTVLLSFMILYWFALVAYVQFHDDFNTAVSESGNTLIGILVVIFDTWYKYDLGAFLMDNDSSGISRDGKYDPRSGRIAFDFLFFFIVPVLLLSIVSGIIIDNFVERRSNSDSIEQRQNDQCFICGESSNELEDFKYHCKYEHNIWDYMYYLGFLRSMEELHKKTKISNRYKDVQSYEVEDHRDIHVKKCLKKRSLHWFPCFRDFVMSRQSTSGDENGHKSINNLTVTNFDTKLKDAVTEGSNLTTEDIKQDVNDKVNKLNASIVMIDAKLDNNIKSIGDSIKDMQQNFQTLNSKFETIMDKLNDMASPDDEEY